MRAVLAGRLSGFFLPAAVGVCACVANVQSVGARVEDDGSFFAVITGCSSVCRWQLQLWLFWL